MRIRRALSRRGALFCCHYAPLTTDTLPGRGSQAFAVFATGCWAGSGSVLTFFSANRGAILKKMTDRSSPTSCSSPLTAQFGRGTLQYGLKTPSMQVQNSPCCGKGGMQRLSSRTRSYISFRSPEAAPENNDRSSPGRRKLSVNSRRGAMAAPSCGRRVPQISTLVHGELQSRPAQWRWSHLNQMKHPRPVVRSLRFGTGHPRGEREEAPCFA